MCNIVLYSVSLTLLIIKTYRIKIPTHQCLLGLCSFQKKDSKYQLKESFRFTRNSRQWDCRGSPTNVKIHHMRVHKPNNCGSGIRGSENRVSGEPPVHTFCWLCFTLLHTAQKWGHANEHALWRGIFETINYFQTREQAKKIEELLAKDG